MFSRLIKDMSFKCDLIVISLILLFSYIIFFGKMSIIEGKRKRRRRGRKRKRGRKRGKKSGGCDKILKMLKNVRVLNKKCNDESTKLKVEHVKLKSSNIDPNKIYVPNVNEQISKAIATIKSTIKHKGDNIRYAAAYRAAMNLYKTYNKVLSNALTDLNTHSTNLNNLLSKLTNEMDSLNEPVEPEG